MEKGPSGVAASPGKGDLSILARQMGDEGDLYGLATVAEVSLTTLRQLCERPESCSDLDELLSRLRALKIELWQMRGE